MSARFPPHRKFAPFAVTISIRCRFNDIIATRKTQQRVPSTPCEPFLNQGAVQLTVREKFVTRETRRCYGNANNLGMDCRYAECTDAHGPAGRVSRRHLHGFNCCGSITVRWQK